MGGDMLHRGGMIGLAGLLAANMAAQTPVHRSAGLDLGALATDELRVGIEPMVFGRWSLHVGLARWAESNATPYSAFTPTRYVSAAGLETVPGNTELALDLTLRIYPAFLSSNAEAHRFRTYAGVGAGLRQRTNARYEPAPCTTRCVYPVATVADRHRGVDPLGEIGIRFEPASSFLLDVGLRTRLVAFDDPTGRFARGEVDPRVVVALGFGW